MTRTPEKRVRDVRAIVEAARTLVDDPELREAVRRSTGLSAEGVDLALTRHLELDPTDAELRQLVGRAGDTSAVTVILSANVFVGALRAIAIARAAAPEVLVRPSRRDPAFARALVEAVNDPALGLVDDVDVASVEQGEIHIYGSDATIADVRARARVRVLGHGAGMGAAWIAGAEVRDAARRDAAARELAADVVAFDQRGCLSPRIALVEGDAGAFADALHSALTRLERIVPRGELPADAAAESARWIGTMSYAFEVRRGAAHAVAVAPVLEPGPAYRHVLVVPCSDAVSAKALLTPIARAITAMGSSDVVAHRIAPAWARFSALGEMQRPRLDGPVDLRDPS